MRAQRAIAAAVLLSCTVAFAAPPSDAPRMYRVEPGHVVSEPAWLLNLPGKAKLQKITDDLQVDAAADKARIASLEKKLEAYDNTPKMSFMVLGVTATVSFLVGAGVAALVVSAAKK